MDQVLEFPGKELAEVGLKVFFGKGKAKMLAFPANLEPALQTRDRMEGESPAQFFLQALAESLSPGSGGFLRQGQAEGLIGSGLYLPGDIQDQSPDQILVFEGLFHWLVHDPYAEQGFQFLTESFPGLGTHHVEFGTGAALDGRGLITGLSHYIHSLTLSLKPDGFRFLLGLGQYPLGLRLGFLDTLLVKFPG